MARLRPIRATDDALAKVPAQDTSEDVTCFGRTVSIKGEVTASEHLIIEGRFDGQVTALEHGVAISHDATVTADIVARTVTVLGHATGTISASELVEIRASGSVEGRIASPGVAIDEGAYFQGFIDPNRAEAAVAVSRHRLQRQRRGA